MSYSNLGLVQRINPFVAFVELPNVIFVGDIGRLPYPGEIENLNPDLEFQKVI